MINLQDGYDSILAAFCKFVPVCDTMQDQITQLEKDKAELVECMSKIKTDMLLRAEFDGDTRVVNMSSSIWERLKELTAKHKGDK